MRKLVTSLVCGIVSAGLMLSTPHQSIAIGPEVEELRVSLHNLVAYAEEGRSLETQKNWREIVASSTAADLPLILRAMGDVQSVLRLKNKDKIGPLTENWLRAAFDAVAEREYGKAKTLPAAPLEEFVQDPSQSPRARRVAYEWLNKVDPTAADRLLPEMLDDASLELRYDAIARLLAEAEAAPDGQAKLQKYRRVLQSAREKSQLRRCAEALKELGHPPDMANAMGFLTEWKVIGPFDNSDRAGFDKVYPPEDTIDLTGEYDGSSGKVTWQDAIAEREDLDSMGIVDFNKALVEEKSVLAYAYTTFKVYKDLRVECRYETKEATKLWVNGEEVAVKNIYHSGGGFDQYVVPCHFKRGENQILIKVCQNEQTQPWTKPWDFRLRVTDELGGAIQQSE